MVLPPGTPLLTAVTPCGTVISKSYAALSDGWSLTGNQVLADSGWPSAIAPSAVCRNPPSPSTSFFSGFGTPSYTISATNPLPVIRPAAGLMTSSFLSRLWVAGAPSTVTVLTVRPARSRLNVDRSAVAVACTVAVPLNWSFAGS